MGNAKEKNDNQGREKVQCRECNLWFHRLDAHIISKHGILAAGSSDEEIIIDAYKAKHKGAPTLSEFALGKLAKKGESPDLDGEQFKFGVARLQQRDDLEDEEVLYVPKHDEGWVLGKDEAELLEALALGIEDNDNILITGPPGIGKSSLVKQLAVICNQPLRRMSFRGDMRTSDLIGKASLVIDEKTGQTVTQYEKGMLPDAADRGHWMLVDEIDAGPPEVMFILHPVLEDERTLMLTGDGVGVEVDFDDKYRFIATANTLGYGDETGLYAGTGPMNEALLDRFGIVIKMGYPSKENEIERVMSRTRIEKAQAEKMIEVATKIREAQKNDNTMTSLSPRRVIKWAQKTVRMGDVRRAAKLTVTNKLPADDAAFVEGIVQRYFGGAVT